MKKLMMAVAIVCAAVAAQAATIAWSQVEGEIMAGNASDIVADAPVYLILSSYSQTDFASAYAAANGDMSATIAAAGSNVVGSSVTDGGFIYEELDYSSADISAYYVVFAADKAYISEIASSEADPLDPSFAPIDFGAPLNSELAAVAAGSYTGGAGWIEAVPEPTSGLLLLLGMAGLALRRRRA